MSISKRMAQWIVTAILLVVLLSAAFAGIVFHRPAMQAIGAETTGAPTTVDPSLFEPPPTPTVEPAHGSGLVQSAQPPEDGALPDAATLGGRIEALDRAAATGEGDQVTFGVDVMDVETGETLAAMANLTPLIPASNTKTLTVVALMNAVADDTRFATRVLQPAPGQVVLVGGGDPMLALEAAAGDSYPEVASLSELAARTAEALTAEGQTSVTVGFDASLFSDDGWNDTWPENYRTQVTPISALWVDTGRSDAGRSRTPAIDAATAFAQLLTAHGITVTNPEPTPTAGGGPELARVESPPVHVLAEMAMQRSDNSWTEVLGFHLAMATGHPSTFEGSVAAIQEQLRGLGAWTDGAVLHDASGLSRGNLVTPAMLSAVNRHIVTDPRLAVILDGMPVAGVTGTLRDRFTDDISRPARGIAKAKTGSLTGVATLAGTTRTADGRVVVYSVMVNGSSEPWATRVWIDQVVGTITSCGC